MVDIIPPLRGEALFDANGRPTLRYSEFWEDTANDANDNSNKVNEGSLEGELAKQSALIARLEARVEDLENSNDSDLLNSRVAQLNRRVNELIDELLIAVQALAPNLEQESEKVVLLGNLLVETALLNARFEEVNETELTKEDL